MIRRAFDENGDYAINKFIEQSAATIQAVTTRLRLFRGEYFLDLSKGVPWYQEVFIKPSRQSEVERIIRNTILQTEGVQELLAFDGDFNGNTRKLTVSFTAKTIYGDEFTEADIEGLNPLGA